MKEPGVIKIYHQLHDAKKLPTKVWSEPPTDATELLLRVLLEQ